MTPMSPAATDLPFGGGRTSGLGGTLLVRSIFEIDEAF